MAVLSCLAVGIVAGAVHGLLIKHKTVTSVMAGMMVCLMGSAFGAIIGSIALAVELDSWVSPPLLISALTGTLALLAVLTLIRRFGVRRAR